MPGVTKDQIKRAREIDVLDYVLSHESSDFRRVGRSYRMREHPSVEIKAGKWRWYSQGLHGRTALDYLTDVRGYDLVKAVCMLLGEKPSERSDRPTAKPPTQPITPKSKPPPEHVPFSLPLRNKDNSRVIDYLQSRGIDKRLILSVSSAAYFMRTQSIITACLSDVMKTAKPGSPLCGEQWVTSNAMLTVVTNGMASYCLRAIKTATKSPLLKAPLIAFPIKRCALRACSRFSTDGGWHSAAQAHWL